MSLNLIAPVNILNNADITGDVTSTPVHIMYSDNVGIQLVWTGTPNGTFDVHVSNTATLNQDGSISGGTYTALGLSPAPTASGSAGNWYIDLNQLGAAFVKLVYTHSSGAGHCTATLTAKPV